MVAFMSDSTRLAWALVVLFVVHFAAFALLAHRRRTWRYMPALVTFALLVALNVCQALDVGSEGLRVGLRTLALLGLVASVGIWYVRRRRARL